MAVSRSGHCFAIGNKARLDDARADVIAECEREAGECRIQQLDAGNWQQTESCRGLLVEWKAKPPVRAFAIARNGKCASSWGYDDISDARKRANSECEAQGSECRVIEEYEGNWELQDDCKADFANWQRMRGRGSFAVAPERWLRLELRLQ